VTPTTPDSGAIGLTVVNPGGRLFGVSTSREFISNGSPVDRAGPSSAFPAPLHDASATIAKTSIAKERFGIIVH